MRWMWVDRFVRFVSGQQAEAIKNVALDQEPVDEYLPGYPVFPCSLMIEGLAQAGGILVSEHFDFDKRVVLAKVGSARFERPARPGDQLRYTTTLESVQHDGALVTGLVHEGGSLLAEVQLMFAFLDARFGSESLFAASDLRNMLQLMRLYEVAVDAEGNPLEVSKNLFDPEPSA